MDALSSSALSLFQDFIPLLIAILVLLVATIFFLIICYQWLKYRTVFLPSSSGDVSDLAQPTTAAFRRHTHGLGESVINTIPSLIYCTNNEQKESPRDCAVCLVEFKQEDRVRTLPLCSHTFHIHCIDTWLRSHPNCPLCRSCLSCGMSESPFRPLMSDRIRPSIVTSVTEITLLTLPTRGSV
ncbi:unnamed protein product [Vicia faba]|uniref:RING-type E3 ubiquitin transferase n=1 Tax=Vicia faba TaxID=3906 RepID=A0AAV0ZIJ2_VICFA|nr:unnamed protein product [Vicia faba]